MNFPLSTRRYYIVRMAKWQAGDRTGTVDMPRGTTVGQRVTHVKLLTAIINETGATAAHARTANNGPRSHSHSTTRKQPQQAKLRVFRVGLGRVWKGIKQRELLRKDIIKGTLLRWRERPKLLCMDHKLMDRLWHSWWTENGRGERSMAHDSPWQSM